MISTARSAHHVFSHPVIALLVLVIILTLPQAGTAEVLDLRSVAEGGLARATHVAGSHVYNGFAHVLVVSDITDPANPVEMAHRLFDGPVRDITSVGNYLYVAAERGLTILDISDPSDPIVVGSIDTPGTAVSVSVSDNHAFVADATSGLRIIDVANPEIPVEVASDMTSIDVTDVAIQEDYAYLSGSKQLLILDISDPTNPAVTGLYDSFGVSSSVAVQGDHAYTLIAINLISYDVSDKADPQQIGSGLVDQGLEITLSGNHAFVASQTGLRIFDISDPTDLTFVGTAAGWQGFDVMIKGSLAYVAYGVGGFDIRDVSDVTDPQMVFDGNEAWNQGIDVAIDGSYAYVAAELGLLKVVDLSDRDHIVEVGNMEFDEPILNLSAIATTGNTAYIAQVPFGFGPVHLEIVDIADPTTPVHTATYDDANNNQVINVMEVAGDYLYTAKGFFGLRIYDITTRTEPSPVANFFTSGEANDLAIDGTITYLLDGSALAGLRVLDTSALPDVGQIGLYPTPGVAKGLALDAVNDRVYIADEGNGLIILDVTTPSLPEKIGELTNIAGASGVAVSGGFAYVTDPDGVHVVDVSDPTAPEAVGTFDQTSGGDLVVKTRGGDVLLLDQFAGLFLLQNDLSPTAIDDRIPTSGSALSQNVPNPFNPQTLIRYTVGNTGQVQLKVYDVSGRLIRTLVNEVQAAGSQSYAVTWDGRDDVGVMATSGVYFYRLVTPGFSETKKMLLLK